MCAARITPDAPNCLALTQREVSPMATRKVVTRSGRRVRGVFPSTKNQRMVAWESLLERDAIVLFELSPGVVAYEEQPSIELYYEDTVPRKYYPDFALTLRDGSIAHVEVKPRKKLSKRDVAQRFDQIASTYQRQSRQFWILTDEEIRRQPRLANLTRCAYHLKARTSSKPTSWELLELRRRNDWTFSHLATALDGPHAVYRLLALGLAYCDFDSPILDSTPISFHPSEGKNDSLYF